MEMLLVTFIPIFGGLFAVPPLCLIIKRLTLFQSSSGLCGAALMYFTGVQPQIARPYSCLANVVLILPSGDNAFFRAHRGAFQDRDAAAVSAVGPAH